MGVGAMLLRSCNRGANASISSDHGHAGRSEEAEQLLLLLLKGARRPTESQRRRGMAKRAALVASRNAWAGSALLNWVLLLLFPKIC
jgi:hypothetical protein